jgi:hypothetical protein
LAVLIVLIALDLFSVALFLLDELTWHRQMPEAEVSSYRSRGMLLVVVITRATINARIQMAAEFDHESDRRLF